MATKAKKQVDATTKQATSENVVTLKNFIVRKSWDGQGKLIKFTNKKGYSITYDHDKALNLMREKLETMNCWARYKYYTSSTDLPMVCRNDEVIVDKVAVE